MSGPPWLAAWLAALMILVAAAAAARLVRWRLRGGHTEPDADALHILMAAAMAGMFEPRISPVPAAAWQAVFAAAAGWFAWRASSRRRRRETGARFAHPAPHAIECGAMIYMLWPTATLPAGHRPASSMPGMAGHAGALAGNPALALVLAVFLLGYILWTIDQLMSRPHAAAADSRARRLADRDQPSRAPDVMRSPNRTSAVAPALAPRLAACQNITMSLAMGYMLLTFL